MLGWFPYSESEKTQLRDLLTKRDPIVMSALRNFLQTKDVASLNKEFKNAILMQQNQSIPIKSYQYEVPIAKTSYQYPETSSLGYSQYPSKIVYQSPATVSYQSPVETVQTSSYEYKARELESIPVRQIQSNVPEKKRSTIIPNT